MSFDFKITIRYKQEDSDSVIGLIAKLKAVAGAKSYDGDASTQVLLPLAGGGYLRVGTTNYDVAEVPFSLWADRYQGISVYGGTNLQIGENSDK